MRFNSNNLKISNVVFLGVIFLLTLILDRRLCAETTQVSDYQSLSLEACLALARENHPAVSGATERIQELVADYQVAKSKFLPRLVLLSYYERTNPDRLSPAGALTTQPLFKEEGLAGVSGKQILFDGRKTYYNSRAAKIATEAQRQEVQRITDEVAFTVTQAFYRLIEAKENLNVAREAEQQRRDFAALTEAFFKAGKVTQLDFFRARSQLSEAEQAKVESQNAVSLAREILASSIGLKEHAQLDIRGQFPQQYASAFDLNSLWQDSLKSNPEVKRLDLDIEQSQTQIKAARGSYFPEVSLQGNFGVRHHDVVGSKGEWLAGIFVEFPFFEGGSTKAEVAKATSQYLQSMERKRDRLNSLRVDLATAWRDQEDARQGVITARQIVATNEESYASAQFLYRNGKAIAIDVLQAQVDLTSSRFSLIRYEVNYEIAKARLRQILGSKGGSEK